MVWTCCAAASREDPKKILVAKFQQETNTFSPIPCDLDCFKNYYYSNGPELYEKIEHCSSADAPGAGQRIGIGNTGSFWIGGKIDTRRFSPVNDIDRPMYPFDETACYIPVVTAVGHQRGKE